jgi:hypothetical protein
MVRKMIGFTIPSINFGKLEVTFNEIEHFAQTAEFWLQFNLSDISSGKVKVSDINY